MIKKILLLSTTLVSIASFTANADDFVEQAKLKVEQATQPTTEWTGPTSGPTAQADKKVVFIASDMKNGGVLGVKEGFEEAAKAVNWNVDVIDGAGSVKDQVAGLNQALATNPDAIVIAGWNPNVARIPLSKAANSGIKLVAWHATPQPGPIEEYNLFYNVTSDSKDVSEVSALYAVAKSEGTAKAVIFTDSLYQIALDKANAMKDVLEQCTGCEVLEFIDTPLSDTSNRMPTMTFSLIQKYGDNLQYALGINDLYFDFMTSSLKASGRSGDGEPYNISAGDGSISAYQRIRDANYQTATVPEPLKLHGWQLIDELNRAFAGEAASGYVTPVHLVTKENIDRDGGMNNVYDPENNYQEEYKKIWGVN